MQNRIRFVSAGFLQDVHIPGASVSADVSDDCLRRCEIHSVNPLDDSDGLCFEEGYESNDVQDPSECTH